MSESFDHAYWVRLAEIDWQVIEACLAREEPPWQGISFHAQQAAEKTLKAFLAFKGELPPRTHDLGDLLERCQRYWPPLSALKSECQELTDLAVDSRYEEFIAEDAEEVAMKARNSAELICNIVSELL